MTPESRVHRFGPFVLEPAERRLLRDGVEVPVRARAFDVLVTLVERAGSLVTKDELLDAVWSELAVEENNLQVQVSALRRLLGPGWITTVPGRGYRFTGTLAGSAARATSPAAEASAFPPAAGVPEPGSPLIGREDDVAAMAELLESSRLVSIVGPGGIGKTRLAQAAARRAPEDSAGPAWIDLAAVTDPSLVVASVAASLGLGAASDPAAAVVDALRAAPRLVVFDNAEHVVETLAPFLDRLRERAPGVRLLVTSQVPCRIAGEQVHRLGALAVPDSGVSPARAADSPAVALFVARARALVGDFRLDRDNLATVIELCRRLDGVPLALELAAGRLPALGLAGLASRLEHRFRLLTTGSRAAPERQQTLEALFDWSYELLGPDEQAVYRRLGTLGSTFALEDAVAVCAGDGLDDWAVVDVIGDLVDRSLVVTSGGDPPRYSLLDSGRAYARSRLDAATDAEAIERAIVLHESRSISAAARSENADALRACTTALELVPLLPPGPARDARELDLCLALGPVIQTTIGPAHARAEAVYRRATALAGSLRPGERPFMALWGLWHFLSMCGRDREAAVHADEIVRLAERLGDDGLELEARHARLTTAQLLGDAAEVVANAERVVALYDPARHAGLGARFGGHDPAVCALGQGAVGTWLLGRPDAAAEGARRAVERAATVEHAYSRAVALFYASFTWCARGDRERLRESTGALAALCGRHAMDMLSNEALLLRGRSRWEDGDRGGIADMQRALDTIDDGGDYAFAILYAALLVEALLVAGQTREAGARLAQVDLYAREGQRFFLPEALRLRGELHAAGGDRAAAARVFAEAAALAEAQGARSLLLRIRTSSLERAEKERESHRRALEAARAAIEGGDETRDVLRARATLSRDRARRD